ncbi:MAG: DUF882 domain-containing protein [Granulosicoccaceae bacterium]
MHTDRRSLLKLGLALTTGSAAASVSGRSLAGSELLSRAVVTPAVPAGPDRRLRLVNAHTWEKLDLTYWTDGTYLDSAIEQINTLMRDHRANKTRQMDLDLLDYLHSLYQLVGTDERIHVLSGYRTAATNAALRARSSGVAKYSLHMEGRAVDINIPTVPTKTVREAAISLQSGGVGYYRKSGFVHIDTGNVRYWQQQ